MKQTRTVNVTINKNSKMRSRQIDKRRSSKEANAKKKKRRKLRKYMLYYILLFIIVITTGVALSVTVFFNIEKFDIDTSVYTDQEVINASKVKVGDNLIRLNLGNVENNVITSLEKLDSVKAKRQFPNSLFIECTEAITTYSCKQKDDTYTYLSQSGRVVSKNEAQAFENTTILTDVDLENSNVGDFIDINNAASKALIDLNDKIDEAGLKDVTNIEITGDNSARITYQDRITIEINDLKKASYILESSVKILSEYIGASEHGVIFYEASDNSIHFLPKRAQ